MKSQKGMAILMVLVLLSIIVIYASANATKLKDLGEYLRDLDQQQQSKFTKK